MGPGGLKLELLGNKLNENNSENGTRWENLKNIQMPFFKRKILINKYLPSWSGASWDLVNLSGLSGRSKIQKLKYLKIEGYILKEIT